MGLHLLQYFNLAPQIPVPEHSTTEYDPVVASIVSDLEEQSLNT